MESSPGKPRSSLPGTELCPVVPCCTPIFTEESVKIGVQQGTTGQSYVQGSEDLGFPGLDATCQSYKSGSLAVQDMLNGNIDYVIIDAAPAASITEAINEMQ